MTSSTIERLTIEVPTLNGGSTKVGRRKWKKETRYHRQARVENTFFRYKQLIGGRLRSRNNVCFRWACKIFTDRHQASPNLVRTRRIAIQAA